MLPAQPSRWEAANAALAAAEGETILLLRGCDSLEPGSVAAMARALAESGADLACARVRLTGPPDPTWARGQDLVHGSADQPARLHAVAVPALAGLAIRRGWWVAQRPELGPDDCWLLSPALAAAYAGGAVVRTVPTAEYRYARGHGRLPFGARPSALTHLAAWRRRSSLVADALAGSPLAKDWAASEVGLALPRLLLDTERATEAEWAQLTDLASAASPAADATPVDARALVWLAAQGRRTDVETLAVELAELGGQLRTELAPAPTLASPDASSPGGSRSSCRRPRQRSRSRRRRWSLGCTGPCSTGVSGRWTSSCGSRTSTSTPSGPR
ncbi:MAG: hypothetical protein R2731_09015 [Nocardioides sp.]